MTLETYDKMGDRDGAPTAGAHGVPGGSGALEAVFRAAGGPLLMPYAVGGYPDRPRAWRSCARTEPAVPDSSR
jgi:hypothetical protein